MDSQDTNLVSQDPQIGQTYGEQSGTSPVSHDDSPHLPTNNPTTVKKSVKKSIRGVNFSPEEDKLLISAWLNCSLDAGHGMDLKHPQLWEKISKHFQQYKETTTERTAKSLINRWSFIQKATNKFCTKLAQVDELNQSGMTEQDKLEKAKIMYQSLEKCTTKDDVKERTTMFPSTTPPRSSVAIDDLDFDLETGNVIENEVIELDWPMGRKAEKGKRKVLKQAKEIILFGKMKYTLLDKSHAQKKKFYRFKAKKLEHDKEKEEKRLHLEGERLRLEAEKWRIKAEKEQGKIRQEDERLRLEAEKLELAKKEADQRIMMMDVSVMQEMQRLYFEELQRDILMRRNHA